MSTNTQANTDAIRDTAKHIAEQPWLTRAERDRMAEQIAKAIHDAVMAERERCARLIEEGYERGIASKRDRCAHSKFEWEDCDECAVAAIRAAPKAEEA